MAGNLADGTVLNNYAQVTTTAFEVSVANNEAADIDTILNEARPNLNVSKTDGKTQVLVGEELTYILTYANTGTYQAEGVSLKDVLPELATLVPGSISDGERMTSIRALLRGTWVPLRRAPARPGSTR